MPKKRTADDSNDDEKTNIPSNSIQHDEITKPEKRVKSAPLLSDTTLQDLPIELLESILLKAVVMEAMGMAKRVWKATADLAISRLGTVCPHWNNILTTDIFRNNVHRILDGTAQQMIHLVDMYQCCNTTSVFRVTAAKDELFALCTIENQDPFIFVFVLGNMKLRPGVIPLPGILPEDMVTCNVSNCVYVVNKGFRCYSVLRITSDEGDQFKVSTVINDLSLVFSKIRLFVSVSGSLVILSHQDRPKPTVVSVYSADGSKQCTLSLSPAIYGFKFIFSVIQKSDGNLVLAAISEGLNTVLKEIDTTGRIVRQYRSSISGDCGVCVADDNGRILIASRGTTAELLDAEFNLLDLTVPPLLFDDCPQIPCGMHYNSERNEVVRLYEIVGINRYRVVTIFRFSG